MLPLVSTIADTLLVRPVDVPTPWYAVASGVMSVIVTLLLLGIAVALLGMARALKNAESHFGGRIQGLTDELIPLAKNLNHIATQLSEVTTAARGDLARISGTIATVDDAVRDALDAGELRLAQFGTLLDAVRDEAQATVASATGLVRGLRTGAGSLASDVFGGKGSSRRAARRTARDASEADALEESAILARIATLEAALAELDDEADDAGGDDDDRHAAAPNRADRRPATGGEGDDADDEEEEDERDEDDVDELDLDDGDDDDDDDDDDDGDDDDDDEDGDGVDDDDDDDDRDEDDRDDDADDAFDDDVIDDDGTREAAPRTGGPQLRRREQA